MNRALRAATMGVLLLSPVALTACSAGQVTQTATQDRDKSGGQADLGEIAVRDARLAYPINGVYQQGGDARLVMAVANGGDTDDTLVSITGEAFDSVEVVQAGAAEAAAGSAPADPGQVSVPVPAGSNVYVGGDGPAITLVGLAEALTPAQSITVDLTFERAGSVSVEVLVGTSSLDLPRGEAYDFHEGEEGGTEGDVARERETSGGDSTGDSAEPSGESGDDPDSTGTQSESGGNG